jgi:hypothetical protein
MLLSSPAEDNSPTPVTEPTESESGSEPEIAKSTPIVNYSDIVKNLSEDRHLLIEQELFKTIQLNFGEQSVPDVKDAVIRNGSYQQTLNNNIYHTSFIVDIESLKQSYGIVDRFSYLPPDISGLYSEAALAVCIDKQELIYGDFNCTDRIKQESGVM